MFRITSRVGSADARRSRRWMTVSVLATAAVLGATACSSSSASKPSSSSDTTAPAAAAAVLGTPNKATGSPVKIGLFNVEGGSTVSLPDIGDAAVAASKYANEYLGGIGGHPIEVDRCADKSDGASATACANRFVEDKVAAVVSGQPSESDQLVPIVNGAGIPYVGASPAGAAEFTTPGLTFFGPGFVGTLSAWASYAKDKGYKKFGVFLVDNPQAIAGVNAIGKPLFDKEGVELQVNTIPAGTADATSVVQAGMGKNPNVVAIVGDGTVCQAVLTGLQTAGAKVPTIGITPCLAKTVVDAVGESALNGLIIFDSNDTVSNHKEAQLYRAVMAKYAPSADAGGLAPNGFVSMLGFVRGVNAGGLTGVPTPASIKAALTAAKNVPLPAGHGETFDCSASAMGTTGLVKSTICSSKFFLTEVKGTKESANFTIVDAAPLFKQ